MFAGDTGLAETQILTGDIEFADDAGFREETEFTEDTEFGEGARVIEDTEFTESADSIEGRLSRCSGLLEIVQAWNSLIQSQLRIAYSSLRSQSYMFRSQSRNGTGEG